MASKQYFDAEHLVQFVNNYPKSRFGRQKYVLVMAWIGRIGRAKSADW